MVLIGFIKDGNVYYTQWVEKTSVIAISAMSGDKRTIVLIDEE